MNILMFLVGFVIFTAYAGFLFWNIFYNHNKNREENYPGYYQRHQPDSIDLDGMGNQGRFPIDPPPRTKAKNCLLYTSPSPRDRTRSRMPSSA